MILRRLSRNEPNPNPLGDHVRAIIADASAALEGKVSDGGRDISSAVIRQEPLDAVSSLVLGFIDRDGLHADEELLAYREAFETFIPSLAGASIETMRSLHLATGQREKLQNPPELLDLLVRVDKREGTDHARRYVRQALDLAHVVCALDEHTSHVELEELERYRVMLNGVLQSSGLPTHAPTVTRHSDGPDADDESDEPRELEEILAELHELIGLDDVKAEIARLADYLAICRIREGRGLAVPDRSLHLVFTGNPGTGKTTVARLIGEIYAALGALPATNFVETDRSGLVAGFVGQTATRTAERFQEAQGGVLFIDEAYALARTDRGGQDFGREAIDTLVKLMEDHRDDTAVIAAGYPKEMADFIKANPGLDSRFGKTIHFPDFSDSELIQIFKLMCERSHYEATPTVVRKLKKILSETERHKGFGNARLMRNIFEDAIAHQASRLVAEGDADLLDDDALMKLSASDIVAR